MINKNKNILIPKGILNIQYKLHFVSIVLALEDSTYPPLAFGDI